MNASYINLVLSVVSALLVSCSNDASPSEVNPPEADSGAVDSASPSPDASAATATDSGEDLGDSSDVDDDLPFAEEFTPIPDTDRWQTRGECAEGPTEVERAADTYEVPNLRFGFDPGGDVQYLRSVFGEDLGTRVGVWFPRENNPGDRFPYDVFAEPGEVLAFTAIFTVEREPGSTVRLDVTVLVDYRPVVASLSIEGPQRNIKDVVEGSGHSFLSEDIADFVAVKIPASEFEAGKNHEIAIALGYRRSGKSRRVFSQRASLFYGGLDPAMAEIPCTPAPLGESLNEFEQQFSNRFSTRFVGIFSDPAPQPLKSSIPATPGETRRIYYSALRTEFEESSTFVLVPTMNGEPTGTAFWRKLGGPTAQEPNPYIVDDRGFFDVTLPTEPGIYEVAVQTWEDPWVRWREFGVPRPPGGFDGVEMVRPTAGSNSLRFVVSE
jgi:hypothetical protein